MNITIRKTVTICAVVLLFCTAVYLLFLFKGVLLYLFIALLVAVAIQPLVSRVDKLKIKKIWTVVIIDLILFSIFLGVVSLIVTPLVQQGISLAQNLPEITRSIVNNTTLNNLFGKYNLTENVNQFINNFPSIVFGGGATVLSVTNALIVKFTSVTIVLVMTFLIQVEGENIWNNFLNLMREKDKNIVQRIGSRTAKAVGGFVSGNLFISLIAGLVTFITLSILHVPYTFALAALVALFDLIPMVGAALATIVVGLVAMTQGVVVASIVVGVLLAYQFVEGHIIQPLVYSKSINLSALLIVTASVFGAEIGGIIGILLAIPVAAIIQIIFTEIYVYTKAS